jgi:glycine/serine hydroxymethyltransferase
METISGFIHEAIVGRSNPEAVESLKAKVREFTKRFPLNAWPV